MHRFQKWRDALQIAPDTKAVMGVMREYVETLPPDVLDVLPSECGEALREHPLDVQCIAVCLLRAELSWGGSAASWQILHDVAHIFALAATRLTLLQIELSPVR